MVSDVNLHPYTVVAADGGGGGGSDDDDDIPLQSLDEVRRCRLTSV